MDAEIDKEAIVAAQNSDEDFSPVDLLYLIKLCQYENEQRRLAKLNLRKYADRMQMAQGSHENFSSFKEAKIDAQVLQFIAKNGIVDLQRQLSRDNGLTLEKLLRSTGHKMPTDASVEVSDVNHGLHHLHATDDELRALFLGT